MRGLKKLIRRVRHLGEFGKVLLAASIMIWFSVAMMPAKWLIPSASDISDACMPVAHCEFTYSFPVQLDLSSPALHVEAVPPRPVKPAHRPSRFGFRQSDR